MKITGTCFNREQSQLSSTGFICMQEQAIGTGVNIWTAQAVCWIHKLDWTAKCPYRSAVPPKSRLLAQTCLHYLVCVNMLFKNTYARMAESWAFLSSAVSSKNVSPANRHKSMDGVGYDNLCEWLALPGMKHVPATSLLYIYLLWNISDFCPDFKTFLMQLPAMAQSDVAF